MRIVLQRVHSASVTVGMFDQSCLSRSVKMEVWSAQSLMVCCFFSESNVMTRSMHISCVSACSSSRESMERVIAKSLKVCICAEFPVSCVDTSMGGS